MFIGIVIKTGLNFFRNVYIGRSLGASALGTFSLANTVFLLTSIISIFGLYNTINRFLPEFLSKKKDRSISYLIGTALKFTAIISILLTIIILFINPLIGELFKDNNVSELLKILIIGLPFYAWTRVLMAIFTSFETTKHQTIVESIQFPIVSTILLVLFVNLNLGYNSISYALLFGYITCFVSSFIITNNKRFKELKVFRTLQNFDKRFLIFAFPLFLNGILFFLMRWLDTLALGYFSDSNKVGIYTATLTLATVPSLLLTSLNTIFFPTISRLISENKNKDAFNAYRSSIRVLSFLTLPYIIFAIIFSKELLLIFGKDFQITTLLMLILSIGSFLNVFSGPVDMTLTAYDKQKYVPINSLIALVVNVVLNVVLIPKYGLVGAAIANTISILIQNYMGILELVVFKSFLPYTKKNLLFISTMLILGILLFILKSEFLPYEITTDSLMIKGVVLAFCLAAIYLLAFIIISVLKFYDETDKRLLLTIIGKIKNGKRVQK